MKRHFGTWQELHSLATPVRRSVFIEEQGVPEVLEWDEEDAIATHLVIQENDLPIATARLIPGVTWRIGRMAVLSSYRKQGIGSQMLKHLIQEAKYQGAKHIQLHAQVIAIPFYARHGFEPTGPIFDEVGIDHVLMTLDL